MWPFRKGKQSRLIDRDSFERNLASQTAMAPQTVAQLHNAGMRPKAKLRLEYFFYAASIPALTRGSIVRRTRSGHAQFGGGFEKTLPPSQPVNPTTETIQGLQHFTSRVAANIAPSYGDTKARASFMQRTQRRLKPKPSVPTRNAKPLRAVQRDATNSAPHLRSKIAVLALDTLDEWPSQLNDAK